jgi:hypothetical protein
MDEERKALDSVSSPARTPWYKVQYSLSVFDAILFLLLIVAIFLKLTIM